MCGQQDLRPLQLADRVLAAAHQRRKRLMLGRVELDPAA
jgi:hypothetical protein